MTAEEMTSSYLQRLDQRLRAYETALNQTVADVEHDYDRGVLDVTETQWQDIIVLLGAVTGADRQAIRETLESVYADGAVSGSLHRLLRLAEHFATLDFSATPLIKREEKA